jgi:hypothetical protein
MSIGARAVGCDVLSGNYPIHPTLYRHRLSWLSLGLDTNVDEMNRLRQYRQPRRIPPDFFVKWREFPTLPAFMSALVFFWCGSLLLAICSLSCDDRNEGPAIDLDLRPLIINYIYFCSAVLYANRYPARSRVQTMQYLRCNKSRSMLQHRGRGYLHRNRTVFETKRCTRVLLSRWVYRSKQRCV